MRQIVPRWTATDPLILDAYTALVDRVGESVGMVHSQGGQFGLKVAHARPDKVEGADPDRAGGAG